MISANVENISRGGAAIVGADLSAGTRGTMSIEALGFASPFEVRAADGRTIRLRFDLDEQAANRLEDALRRTSLTRAA